MGTKIPQNFTDLLELKLPGWFRHLSWGNPISETALSKASTNNLEECTPLWRNANLEVKMFKTPHGGSTFWSWDVEKMHAAVAKRKMGPKKLPEILGVEESFKIRRSVSEIQRKKLWVWIESFWFNENKPNTQWWTLMTVDCPFMSFIKFSLQNFHPLFLCTPAKQKELPPKKSRTFRWSFASSQVLQRQPQVNHPWKSCRSVSYPVFRGDCGWFNRGYLAVTGIDSSCGLVSSSCGFTTTKKII